jgi:ABC-2 type transport system ATP-binding protein
MANQIDSPMIEARGLTRYFGAFVAIKDVTFSVPRGQVVAFLGPNGAGKSTTMKILTGYLSASEGTARICDLDVATQRLQLAARLGYLPENGPLYDDMTPLELLRFFGEARGLDQDRLKERIAEVTRLTALDAVMEKPIGKLSRGYRQRVGLAQVMLHDPEVLIMDEPTAGLDPNQIRDFRDNIGRLRTSKTILISTHILQEAEAVADRILLISGGKLVFDGTPQELKQADSLEQAFYRLTGYGNEASSTAPQEQGGAA